MNLTQQTARDLGRRAQESRWDCAWTLFVMGLTMLVGLASYAFFSWYS